MINAYEDYQAETRMLWTEPRCRMNDAKTPKGRSRVGKMPNLTIFKVVFSERVPTQYELEHAKREVERLVLNCLGRSARVELDEDLADS